MKRYYNAYKGKDGVIFDGDPWIDELSSKKVTIAMLSNLCLREQGYIDVRCFWVDEERRPEKITWEYILEHEIVNYRDVFVV